MHNIYYKCKIEIKIKCIEPESLFRLSVCRGEKKQMAGERWLFTRSQLMNAPSRKCGVDSDKETYYRQQAANFVQDMGQRLQVYPLPRKHPVENDMIHPRGVHPPVKNTLFMRK